MPNGDAPIASATRPQTSGLLIRDPRASGATGDAAAPPGTVPPARERWHAPTACVSRARGNRTGRCPRWTGGPDGHFRQGRRVQMVAVERRRASRARAAASLQTN